MVSHTRLVSVIAVLALLIPVISFVPTETSDAVANEYDFVYKDLGYNYADDSGDVNYAGYAGKGTLTNLVIPATIEDDKGNTHKVVGIEARSICSTVESLTIGKNVTEIYKPCLDDTDGTESMKLAKISVEEGNQKYHVDNEGMLLMRYNGENISLIIMCPPAKQFSYEGKEGVFDSTKYYLFDEYAFYCCINLKEIIMIDELNVFKKGVFSCCTNLKTVHTVNSNALPSYAVIIDSWAFSYCSSLETITMGNKLTTIGESAFYSCESLKSIHLGDEIVNIAPTAFIHCNSLSKISVGEWNPYYSVPGDGEKYQGILMKNQSISGYSKSIALYPGGSDRQTLTIDNDVSSIDQYAFSFGEGKLKEVYINEMEDVDYAAFIFCQSLETVHLDSTVKIIDDYAFANCSSLKEITGTKSLTQINYGAFSSCFSLKSITLYDKLTLIDDRAFFDSGLEKITIPSSVKKIDEWAFAYASGLKEITLEGEPTIGKNALDTHCNLTIYKHFNFSIPSNAYSADTNVTIINTDEWHFPWYNVVGIIICLLILAGMVHLFRRI